MKRFIRLRRPTHTTVVAYLSFFLVVSGGAAYAATKIGARQLRPNAVTATKIARNAVTAAKIAPKAVTGAKIEDGAVTSTKIGANAVGGAQADEASFKGLVKGEGSVSSHAVDVPAVDNLPAPAPLATVPGFGEVNMFFCGSFDKSLVKDQMGLNIVAAPGAQPFTFVGHSIGANNPSGTGKPQFSDFAGSILSDGNGSTLSAQLPGAEVPGPFGIDGRWEIQFGRAGGPGATIVVSAFNSSSSITNTGVCHVVAQTTIAQ